MNVADNKTSNKKIALVASLFSVAFAAAVLSSLPVIQNKIQQMFPSENRRLLAKIQSFYGPEQAKYLLLKIANDSGLSIEIYQEQADSGQPLLKQKFELLHDSDAYMTLDKNATNFALSDVDKDGQMDLLAPSVDRNGDLRLNTYRFNSELKSFEPLRDSTAN